MSNLHCFTTCVNKTNVLSKDKNGREINIFEITDLVVSSNSLTYPSIHFFSYETEQFYSPYKEKVMSLELAVSNKLTLTKPQYTKINKETYFFFGYNTDNYYHFLYDSIPYLISFFRALKKQRNIKLLMATPVHGNQHYKFVTELLELLSIPPESIEFIQSDTLYKRILFSNSYTHDFNSNIAPRQEVYDLFASLSQRACDNLIPNVSNVYISRRTWLHNDRSNIGTDYTTRRMLTNETEVVEFLNKKNYKEIFSENLTTIERISLFAKATNVIGPIGGGMSNVLFCRPETNVLVLMSPTFFDVNERFNFCFANTNTSYFNDTRHSEQSVWKKYIRVQHKQSKIIGEIDSVDCDKITVKYTDKVIAGWSNSLEYNTSSFHKNELVRLDKGLNSNWKVSMNKLKKYEKGFF